MKKGSYVVQEVYESSSSGVKGGGGGGGGGYAPPPAHHRPDSSYSSCLLALLFFLALCVIIMLAAWPWNRGKEPHPAGDHHETEGTPEHGGLHGGSTTHSPHHHGDGEHPKQTTTPAPSSHHPPHTTIPTSKTTPKTTTTTTKMTTTTTTTVHPEPPSEVDEEEYEDGGHPHHPHPHPHHPHHHETTTPHWDPMKETTTMPEGHGHVKNDRRKTVKGLSPRIGGEEDYDSEWVNTTNPSNTTEKPKEGKSDRLIQEQIDETGGKDTTIATPMVTNEEIEGKIERKGGITTTMNTNEETKEKTTMATLSSLDDVHNHENSSTDAEVCQTKSCKALAARMLALMDHSIEPCDDFYQYACGGMTGPGSEWISEEASEANAWSRISDMMTLINESSPMSHQKFKSFHDSCIFYDHHVNFDVRLEKARDVLASVGRFYRDNEWKETPGNLTVLIGNLLKHHFSPLFDILLDVDAKSHKFTLKLTAPMVRSPFGDIDGIALSGWKSEKCQHEATKRPQNKEKVDLEKRYHEYANCSSQYEEYVGEVEKAIDALQIIKYENETDTQKLIRDTSIYMDLFLEETQKVKIKKLSPGEKRRILLAKEFKMYTMKDLNAKFPQIDWIYLTSMLLGENTSEETEIQVYFEDYFQDFFHGVMSATEARHVNNALMGMFAHELYHGLVVNRSPCNRKAYCLTVAKELMDPVASSLFIQSFDAAQLSAYQSKIETIFNSILLTLKYEISTLTWMDKNSQTAALDKLQNLRLYADGGVSVFRNARYLDSQFATVAANETYIENAVDLMKRYRERMYEVYRKNPSEPEQIWSHFLLPYREQGIVIYGLNSIVIPYGRMIKPYFSEDYPLYAQMSGLGFMISHEIWHQFDTTGIRYDARGHRDSKFSGTETAAITKTADCLTDQTKFTNTLSTNKGEVLSYKLNPAVSLNERLVDIGGAHLAYKTALKFSDPDTNFKELPWTPLKPKQLFFLSLAQQFCTKASMFDYVVSMFEDEHLPPLLRVKDITFHSKEFSEAFECEAPQRRQCLPFTVHG